MNSGCRVEADADHTETPVQLHHLCVVPASTRVRLVIHLHRHGGTGTNSKKNKKKTKQNNIVRFLEKSAYKKLKNRPFQWPDGSVGLRHSVFRARRFTSELPVRCQLDHSSCASGFCVREQNLRRTISVRFPRDEDLHWQMWARASVSVWINRKMTALLKPQSSRTRFCASVKWERLTTKPKWLLKGIVCSICDSCGGD